MTIAFVLIVASALVGMATGYFFRIWALVVISPLIAIFSAGVLKYNEYGLVVGVTIIAACLAVCQLAYLAMTYLLYGQDVSAHDEINGEPREQGERKIRGQKD
ncbi:hypothetical protein [Bradyrhizobium sp. Bra64]|uniref:hypothetical protein n=1 Tax=Bradyrhizobium sp. Bra64 TaxID=2926009 RepID=UPI002119A278|nr:hypothetical protein [Bradyrhizobium sp. Bra64]